MRLDNVFELFLSGTASTGLFFTRKVRLSPVPGSKAVDLCKTGNIFEFHCASRYSIN